MIPSDNKLIDKNILEKYEQLRNQVLIPHNTDSSLGSGLALFINRGMLVWMNVWQEYIPPLPEEKCLSEMDRPIPQNIMNKELISIITNMIFSHNSLEVDNASSAK